MAIEQLCFDYASLDSSTRTFVQEKAQSIHARLKRTAEDIIAIGQDLIEVKARLGHGKFQDWLQSEFEMNYRSAVRFMHVTERFRGSDKLSHLPISVLYELAAPSTPETVVEMVETYQIPATIPAIREAKREFQQENAAAQRSFPDAFYHDTVIPAEETEETRYQTAVDMGTTDLYYDNLRREAIQRDKEERRDTHVMRVMGSSDSPEWYTPREIIERVLACFGEVDVDPCSNSHDEPAVPARILYTRDDDGLSHGWEGKVYLNPPYGDEIKAWVQRLVQEYESGAVTEAIALLPARIDTIWFQPLYAYPMCNVRGRLQFENSPYHCPFPCVVVYLGRTPGKFISTFKELGPIMGRIG